MGDNYRISWTGMALFSCFSALRWVVGLCSPPGHAGEGAHFIASRLFSHFQLFQLLSSVSLT